MVHSNQQLKGKVALVTGASGGIGEGVARAYAEQGATVIIASRNECRGKAAADRINSDYLWGEAVFYHTDVADRRSLEGTIDLAITRFSCIDILVNNATPSGGSLSRLEHLDTELVEQHIAVNYYASLWGMQRVFPAMKDRGWGRIINMASLNGINAHRYSTSYNASKEALRALTRTAAAEWGQYGISCNIICPAAATEPWQNLMAGDKAMATDLIKQIPMRRMGDCQKDIGPLAVFLASDGAAYITGNTIHADGGGHINGVPWNIELPE